MEQPRYTTLPDLITGGTKASGGAGAHGANLNLMVGSKVLIDADLGGLTGLFDAHRGAKAELTELRRELKDQNKVAGDFLFVARDSLKRSLGRQYSIGWDGTGFTSSLKIPRSVTRRQHILRSLQSYLGDHPERETADVVTAALVGTRLDELTNAQTAVDLQKSLAGTHLTNRKQKEKAMRLRLRWLADELGRLMGPLDDRWTAFGLNKPALKRTPAVPTKLSVVLMNNIAASLKWEGAARAEYYRVWIKVIGIDLGMRTIGSPADLDFTIESLPGNSAIEVAVSAMNNGGESALSEVVTITAV